jgi:hypothetical protein
VLPPITYQNYVYRRLSLSLISNRNLAAVMDLRLPTCGPLTSNWLLPGYLDLLIAVFPLSCNNDLRIPAPQPSSATCNCGPHQHRLALPPRFTWLSCSTATNTLTHALETAPETLPPRGYARTSGLSFALTEHLDCSLTPPHPQDLLRLSAFCDPPTLVACG